MNRQAIRAVHDDDLEGVLRGLGLYRDFVNGRISCAFCREAVNWDNLHSLFPDSGAVKCSCSRPECVKALLSRIGPKLS